MKTQNLTIKLEKKLLESARMLAASRSISLSELFADFARKALAKDAGFRERRKRFRDRLGEGLELNTHGQIQWDRADLHER